MANVDILLICALKDEYDQVLKVADGLQTDWQEHPLDSGWMIADARFTTSSGSTLSIRATHASYMGREQAQATASKLIHDQPARCIAMSGICAGRRGKVALGDVIFAERLWSYDAGKLTVEDGQERFQGDQLQYRPSSTWVQRMQHVSVPALNTSWLSLRPALSLEQQEDWVLLRALAGEDPSQHADCDTACPNWSDVLPRLWQRKWLEKPLTLTAAGQQRAEELNLLYHGNPSSPPDFNIHVAPMATGAAVSENESIFPHLAESMRKVLGIEMEASALGALGEIHNIPVLVAKGVSDYGDSFKDNRYREFAARAAAECLLALLRKSADLLSDCADNAMTSPAPYTSTSTEAIDLNLPRDLLAVLAEEYPDVRDARALWQRAGGKARDVENNSRPFDLWQRLWQRNMQGALARPEMIVQAALDDFPNNDVLLRYLGLLNK
ncbi:MAG: effector-associated domain EAD1-containing protein [Methylobacter sp.]|nr:effector-associated domain EAD1-containing protein [Methylobacter sp.]